MNNPSYHFLWPLKNDNLDWKMKIMKFPGIQPKLKEWFLLALRHGDPTETGNSVTVRQLNSVIVA